MDDSKKWISRMFGYEKAFCGRERKILSQGSECGRCGYSHMGELYLFDDIILCGLCACHMGKMILDENGKLHRP
jgi:bacterioferritin-associated ferredoxin